jgi:hypothetical protein
MAAQRDGSILRPVDDAQTPRLSRRTELAAAAGVAGLLALAAYGLTRVNSDAAEAGPWLLAACGFAVAGIGVFFVVLRPPLLPEDRRYIAASPDVLEAAMPGLGLWLKNVFRVLGGYAVATGTLTTYVPLTGVRDGSAVALVIAAAAGISSIGLMALINLELRSDFRWPLLGLAVLWAVAVLLSSSAP